MAAEGVTCVGVPNALMWIESGLSISHKGDLALIANRDGKSVSVVSIEGSVVKAVTEVPMGEQAAAVVITPRRKTRVCMPERRKQNWSAHYRRSEGHVRQVDGYPISVQSL